MPIGQIASAKLGLLPDQIGQTESAQSKLFLYDNICWRHYERLMRLTDKKARLWYLEETAREQWSVSTLRWNISTQYYYRLLQTPEQKRFLVEKEMQEKDRHIPKQQYRVCKKSWQI